MNTLISCCSLTKDPMTKLEPMSADVKQHLTELTVDVEKLGAVSQTLSDW